MGESLFSWITLLTISMVSAEQGPSVSATLFLCCMCQGRTFESAPPDHNTLVACSLLQKASKNGAQYVKKMPCGSWRLRSTFCEVSCFRRSGLREYLLSNRLLVSELKKSCSEVHAFLDFLQQKFRGAVPRRVFLRLWAVYLRYLWPLILTQLLPFSRLLSKPRSDSCHCPLREATWLPKCRWSSWT